MKCEDNSYGDILHLSIKMADPSNGIRHFQLKWNKDARGAIDQIHERRYTDGLKEYHGNLILAGINYDKETKKHSCKIEKFIM